MSGTVSYWHQRARAAAVEADVVVVGAGIVGASAAYWIRQLKPGSHVVLIDRGAVAAGASGRNAGFLLRGTPLNFEDAVRETGREAALWLYRFTDESITRMLERTSDADVRLAHTGSLLAAGGEAEREALRLSVEALREAGYPVEYWSASRVHERAGAEGFHGGFYDPGGATVDPLRLVRHLAQSSQASLYEHHEALGVESDPAGRAVVECAARSFVAPAVILALNAYLPRLIPALTHVVSPVRAQMLAADVERGFKLPLPVYSHNGYFYVRSADDGTLLIGGARHRHAETEVGYEDSITPGLQADLVTYANKHFPASGHLSVKRRWSGTMGFSPDGVPVVGQLDELRAVWAAGFTGHGMAFGFGIGRLLARLALGEEGGSDAAHFSARRAGIENLPVPPTAGAS